MTHTLTGVEPTSKKMACECGETFAVTPAGFKKWQAHVDSFKIIHDLYTAVAQEHQARAHSEALIVKAKGLGMSTAAISKACGVKGDGKPLISSTSIQRIIRTHTAPESKTSNAQTPRRRRS